MLPEYAEPDSEVRKLGAALAAAGFNLQLSGDWPANSVIARGKRLWNVIAPDGSHRGQLLLSAESN